MKVVVRVRPPNAKELGGNNPRSIIRVIDEKMLIFDPKEEEESFFYHGVRQNHRDLRRKPNKDLEFYFDHVFDCDSSNEAVFNGTTESLVTFLLDGYNCSVFAYGATGAGKTFTMLGSKTSPGITYLTIMELYKQMDTLTSEREFELAVSHLEVYNENVRDLIRPSSPLSLIDVGTSEVRIPGLSIHCITNADNLFALMAQGNKNRTQHPTDANAESSRSHSVFQVYVRMTNKLTKSVNIMKLSMIDLAGSERASASGCKGKRFTEGANINKSLLALGNCISSLADGQKYVAYRGSKLTRLLKDSLGGSSHTVMIANLSPSSSSYEDTYNTLKYAARAKQIKNRVKKNVVTVQMNATQYAKALAALTEENERLKLKLQMYEADKSAIPVVAPAVLPSYKDKLLLPFKELETLNKDILKLTKEIKLLKWRIRVKQKIANRLPCLMIDTIQMKKRLDRIRMSTRQLEGREISFRQKLRETFMKRIECVKSMNCLIKRLDEHSTNIQLQQDIANLHLQLEVQEKNFQLEHSQQLLSMQQNELESEATVVQKLSSTLKNYRYLLEGHNLTTDTMVSEYDELAHKVEGFKHVSWKNDKEIDEICNFTFSIAEWSKQNLFSESIINAKALPEPVANCGEGSSSSNSVSTVTSQVPELSDGGDFKQCGNSRLNVTFDVATLRVSSANRTVPGPDSKTCVTGSNIDLCVTLQTASEDGQASLPQNTEVLEAQGPIDKTAEYCGILREVTLLADNSENIAPKFVRPLKVDCDVTVPNDGTTDGTVLNDTFVLAEGSSLPIQNRSSRSFAEKSYSQQNIQNTVNNSAHERRGSVCNEHMKKWCFKENRPTDVGLTPSGSATSTSPMYRTTAYSKRCSDHVNAGGSPKKLKPSPSYQRGGCNTNKYQPRTLSGPVTRGQTPQFEHYQDPVTMEALGRKGYFKRRRQLNKAYPRVK